MARRSTTVLATALVAVVTCAGCAADGAATVTDAPASGESSGDAIAPSAATPSTRVTVATGASASPPVGDEAFCDAVVAFDRVSPPGGPSDPTPDQMQAFAGEIGPLVEAMEQAAPAPAAPAVAALADGVELAASGDAGAGEDPDLSAAIDTIEQSARTQCGFPELDVTATDFAFDAPATIPAGPHSLRLTNDGEAPHLLLLVGAPEDRSDDVGFVTTYLEAIGEADATGGDSGLAKFTSVEGNPPFADPGGSATVTADLEPGDYIYFCPLPMDFSDPESAGHYESGMLGRLTVEG